MNEVMVYKGPVNDGIISSLLATLTARLSERNVLKRTIGKIQGIALESLQNVGKHNNRALQNEVPWQFQLIHYEDSFQLSTHNVMEVAHVSELESVLHQIKKLTQHQLSDLYAQQLKKPFAKAQSGAGLGLIAMARKCKGNFKYCFTHFNAKCCSFELTFLVR
jgi:hypothetical protein